MPYNTEYVSFFVSSTIGIGSWNIIDSMMLEEKMHIFMHFLLNTKQVYLFICEFPDKKFISFYSIDGCFLLIKALHTKLLIG
jgi:hypothetical protein